MSSDWVLYYWSGFPGRGEFVRLVFEEARVKYTEMNDWERIKKEIIEGEGGYPEFAPPMIKKGTHNMNDDVFTNHSTL